MLACLLLIVPLAGFGGFDIGGGSRDAAASRPLARAAVAHPGRGLRDAKAAPGRPAVHIGQTERRGRGCRFSRRACPTVNRGRTVPRSDESSEAVSPPPPAQPAPPQAPQPEGAESPSSPAPYPTTEVEEEEEGDHFGRPYSRFSPFNRELPKQPRLDPYSQAIVSRLVSWGEPQGLLVGQPEDSGRDYGHPVYYSSPSDPVYRIHCTQWTGSCAVEGMRIRIPAVAQPASGSDAHMVVIDPKGGWEYDFWQVHTDPLPAKGGELDVSHGGRLRWGKRADATGLGGGATAADFGLQAGVVGAEEWAAATEAGAPIEHALFMSVRCSAGFGVYPAPQDAQGSACTGSELKAAPPLGAHFFLEMSDAEIEALGAPPWKEAILKAMARYGLFVGDTFGGDSNSFGLAAESDTQFRALGEQGIYSELGEIWGAPRWQGTYLFDLGSGVDWADDLRVTAPCVAEGKC